MKYCSQGNERGGVGTAMPNLEDQKYLKGRFFPYKS
jgi:hypothetical protein